MHSGALQTRNGDERVAQDGLRHAQPIEGGGRIDAQWHQEGVDG